MAAKLYRASILRDAVLRTTPQDEVRKLRRLLRGRGAADTDVPISGERIHVSSSSFPPTGICGAVSFCVMTRLDTSPLRCHWPETSGGLVTFLTVMPAHCTGPTIDL